MPLGKTSSDSRSLAKKAIHPFFFFLPQRPLQDGRCDHQYYKNLVLCSFCEYTLRSSRFPAMLQQWRHCYVTAMLLLTRSASQDDVDNHSLGFRLHFPGLSLWRGSNMATLSPCSRRSLHVWHALFTLHPPLGYHPRTITQTHWFPCGLGWAGDSRDAEHLQTVRPSASQSSLIFHGTSVKHKHKHIALLGDPLKATDIVHKHTVLLGIFSKATDISVSK